MFQILQQVLILLVFRVPEATSIFPSSKVYLEIAMTKMGKRMTVDRSFKLHELGFDNISCQTICWQNIQLLKD